MAPLTRAFLDHNGVLTDFKLADGTPAVSSVDAGTAQLAARLML